MHKEAGLSQPSEAQQPFGGGTNAPQDELHPAHGPPEAEQLIPDPQEPSPPEQLTTVVLPEMPAASPPVEIVDIAALENAKWERRRIQHREAQRRWQQRHPEQQRTYRHAYRQRDYVKKKRAEYMRRSRQRQRDTADQKGFDKRLVGH